MSCDWQHRLVHLMRSVRLIRIQHAPFTISAQQWCHMLKFVCCLKPTCCKPLVIPALSQQGTAKTQKPSMVNFAGQQLHLQVAQSYRLSPVCCTPQVPNPLPLSWGRTVKPYKPATARQCPSAATSDAENEDSSNGQQVGTSYLEEEDVLNTDFQYHKQTSQAVQIKPRPHL